MKPGVAQPTLKYSGALADSSFREDAIAYCSGTIVCSTSFESAMLR